MEFKPTTKNISISLNSDELKILSELYAKGFKAKHVFIKGLKVLQEENKSVEII